MYTHELDFIGIALEKCTSCPGLDCPLIKLIGTHLSEMRDVTAMTTEQLGNEATMMALFMGITSQPGILENAMFIEAETKQASVIASALKLTDIHDRLGPEEEEAMEYTDTLESGFPVIVRFTHWRYRQADCGNQTHGFQNLSIFGNFVAKLH